MHRMTAGLPDATGAEPQSQLGGTLKPEEAVLVRPSPLQASENPRRFRAAPFKLLWGAFRALQRPSVAPEDLKKSPGAMSSEPLVPGKNGSSH